MLRRNILNEHLVSWTTLSLIVVLVFVVVVRVSTLVSSVSGTITILIVVHLTTIVLRPVVVKERLAEIHLLLEKKKNLLNKLKSVWLLKNASIYLGRSKLLPLIVEISLVLTLILLLLADFRKLIMSHIEILSVDRSTVELLSSHGCAIGLLVANKCAGRRLPIMRGKNFHAFNFSKISEMGPQVLFIKFRWEVLDEEVALLLGVLESLLLSPDNTLSLKG